MRSSHIAISVGLVLASFAGLSADEPERSPLRAGMIGLDTSHVPAFTRLFNNAPPEDELAAVRIVAGYPGGTEIPASRDRVERFTEQVLEMGVEIVGSIPELLEKVDVVLIESVDGRIHLEEAIPVIRAGKPLFIDKPAAGTLADVIAIFEFAKQHDVPCFSSSSLRYGPALQDVLKNENLGEIAGAATWGSCSYQPGTPDLFFYGVHGVEALYTLMGTGCQTVTRTDTRDTDLVTGTWQEGRVGTFRGIRRNKAEFGAMVFGTRQIIAVGRSGGYGELCREIARFFRTSEPPVDAETTIEIFAFMEAADESKRRGGQPVSIEEVMAKAREEAAARLVEFTRSAP